MSDEKTVTVVVPLPDQRLSDLLCTAVEGGSNYWAPMCRAVRTDGEYQSVDVFIEPNLVKTATGKCSTYVEHGVTWARVTLDDLRRGVSLLTTSPKLNFAVGAKHLADIVNENDDAETADVVLQLALFGEIVFG